MKKLLATLCLTIVVLLGNVEKSESAEPINGICLPKTKHFHSPIAGKCSASYEAGDYGTALREFQPLAKQGNAAAQNNLGFMYHTGEGVPKDNVYAHMWWNIAASSGEKDVVTNRDIIAKRMTPAQIVEAQKLAGECVKKKYNGCDD